jgi:hypothetical protein
MGFIKIVFGVVAGLILAFFLLAVGCSVLYKKGSETRKIKEAQSLLSLEVSPNWEWERGSSYSEIKGRVKNVGSVPIRYWKITAMLENASGEILNKEIDNSIDLLRPQESTEFKMMFKNNSEYKKASIEVTEVRLDN